ncbi:DUF1883 domain-containing protein [Nocardia vinacea]|uniref:DUF1883 domain-containing protein n=1 Tax=Nocardia vinacea TaxID=96468 RepID=A0ABZ1Z7G5_9NOCA|nr:DUF1883 domain-containing protein [Nocardia vinacea]
MNFQVFDLHNQKRGSVVVVTLQGNAANVRLLSSSNYQAYKNGRSHRYEGGGLVERSPHRMVIPRDGHWYVTVDLAGMGPRAKVRSAVAIEPPSLPVARSSTPSPLSEVRVERPPAAVAEEFGSWDVFISHASEDKDEIARPLYTALSSLGVEVWFDEAELGIGDSLRRKIDQGLLRSAFGVVVFSDAFFAKGWPQYELDGIVTRSVAGEQNLLPIWHNMTRDQIWAKSPSLADKIGRSTAQFSVEEIAAEIAERVRPDLFQKPA